MLQESEGVVKLLLLDLNSKDFSEAAHDDEASRF